jgi:hypothetical protein
MRSSEGTRTYSDSANERVTLAPALGLGVRVLTASVRW